MSIEKISDFPKAVETPPGYTEEITRVKLLSDINKECERVKIKKHSQSENKDYYEARVDTVIGPTTFYKWADAPKSLDWTYSLPRRDADEKPRDPLVSANYVRSMVNAPTSAEWDLMVDFYVKGKFTPQVVKKLNLNNNHAFYFDRFVEKPILEIIGQQKQQKAQRERADKDAALLKKQLERNLGEGVCGAHLNGFARDHQGQKCEVTFLNPAEGAYPCKQCGSPVAVAVIRVLKK
jgi:hypothetical protein